MGSCQVKGGLEVGFIVRPDWQALQGIQPFVYRSRGESPTTLCNQQNIAGLQMPQVRRQRAFFYEALQRQVRARLFLIIEEPGHDNGRIDDQAAHRR